MPGFSRAQWSRLSGYSLKMIASSPTASPTAAAERGGVERGRACASFAAFARRALWRSISLRAARLDVELLLRQRRIERGERDRGRRGDRQIARERAHRIAREHRVLADMRDAAAGGRLLHARIPRRVAFDDDDQVGLADQRAGIEARMHRMRRRAARPSADCAQTTGMAARSATVASAATALLVRARARRDDQRPLGLRDPARQAARSPPDRDAPAPAPGAARSPASSASDADSGSRGSTR